MVLWGERKKKTLGGKWGGGETCMTGFSRFQESEPRRLRSVPRGEVAKKKRGYNTGWEGEQLFKGEVRIFWG